MKNTEQATPDHRYAGIWVTADGFIRHKLLTTGRYDEARGKNKGAWQGRYEIVTDHIQYWDDTGFTADGHFHDNVLYHVGIIFYRQ